MNGRPPPRDRDDRRRPTDRLRINHRIRVPEVRVIVDEGEQLGVIPTHEALRIATEKGLDLVEISPRSFPPVCRIMDYGKYKYEQAKKKQQARKHASTVEIKEIKFRPKTEQHDMDFKVKHVRTFLEEGNKVRLAVVFRGREITHPQTGMAVLNRVIEATADISSVEVTANLEGKRMIMILAPKPGVVRKAQQLHAQQAAAEAKARAKSGQPGAGKGAPGAAAAVGADGKPAQAGPNGTPEGDLDDDDLDEDDDDLDEDDEDDDEDGEPEAEAEA
jgi:translation initiation factor IF-3